MCCHGRGKIYETTLSKENIPEDWRLWGALHGKDAKQLCVGTKWTCGNSWEFWDHTSRIAPLRRVGHGECQRAAGAAITTSSPVTRSMGGDDPGCNHCQSLSGTASWTTVLHLSIMSISNCHQAITCGSVAVLPLTPVHSHHPCSLNRCNCTLYLNQCNSRDRQVCLA